jgi:superfamily I DNA/RNA helicase
MNKINKVQTQTTTDNATEPTAKQWTRTVNIPTQSQAFISNVAKDFNYKVKFVDSKSGYLPCLYKAKDIQKEADFIQEKIRQLTSTEASSYSEIAILCQNPSRLTTLATALNKAGIPVVETHHNVGDHVFRVMKSVMEIIDWVAYDYPSVTPVNAITEMVKTLNQPDDTALSLIENISKDDWRKFRTSDETQDVVKNLRNTVIDLANQILVTKASFELLTKNVLALLKLSYTDNKSVRVIKRDLKQITDSLARYSDWRAMINNFPSFTTQGVELTTCEVKNKCWKNVLLVNLIEGVLPRDNSAVAKEQELFFNAITCHTKSVVIVQSPASKTVDGETVRLEKESSFVTNYKSQLHLLNRDIMWVNF